MAETIRVIYKQPGERPCIMVMPNTREALQDAVGGYIECVTMAADAAVICNEEGRMLRLPRNCDICGHKFVGPILIVGVSGDAFCRLAEDICEMLLNGIGWRDWR